MSNSKDNNSSHIDEKKERFSNFDRKGSERIMIYHPEKEEREIIFNGYIFHVMNYDNAIDAYEKEKREGGICFTFLTLIKNNSLLFFILPIDVNDLFIKISILILALSLYIFLNIILMYNSSILHLYIGKEIDEIEKEDNKYILMNLLVPFLFLYFPTLFLMKYISIREFFYEYSYKYSIIINNLRINKAQKQLRLHDIQTQISKFNNLMDARAFKLFIMGSIFLLINWYVSTCFCGIYENSNKCLIINTFISIIFTLVLKLLFFLVSSIIRILGFWLRSEIVFKFSRIFNPTFLLYSEESSLFLVTFIYLIFLIIGLLIIMI